ncbi:hypothetical protein [Phormidesmis sp. 146-33]
MRLLFLSKAVRTLGVMTMLSVMVGTTVQQSAQAQNRIPTQWEVSCSNWTSSGIFDEFQGIKLTPEQNAAYVKFGDEADAKTRNLPFFRKRVLGSDPTPEQQAEIDKILRKIEAQIAALLTPEQQKVYQETCA